MARIRLVRGRTRLLKVRDVAELAGVGYNTVIEWVKAGLTTIRPGGRRSHLIDPNDLEAFLQQHKSSREKYKIEYERPLSLDLAQKSTVGKLKKGWKRR